SDSFLSRVKLSAGNDVPGVEPVPAELLEAARSIHSEVRDQIGRPTEKLHRLGRFELLEELGIGSFGQVFRARDTELGRTVAIKLLRAGPLARREEVDRFACEARSAAQLKHPGLVALYESGQTEEGTFYLVEEFVQGETLAARLRTGRVTFQKAAE